MRSYDKEGDQKRNILARRFSDLSGYVHAVLFVLDANDPFLMDGKYRDKLRKIREHLSQEGNKDCYPYGTIHVTTLLLISTLKSHTPYAYAAI